ncbi:hypothetical protein BCU66_016175 [Vibrio sp. 10N.286.49.B1]|nr:MULTISPECIES: hypothetical protein [unclassified Vibrio]
MAQPSFITLLGFHTLISFDALLTRDKYFAYHAPVLSSFDD